MEARVVQVGEAPIETPGEIRTVEIYQTLLRPGNERIKSNSGVQISDQECLDLEVFTLNCTVGSRALWSGFLV